MIDVCRMMQCMSIAVSVLVKSSKLLRLMVCAIGVLTVFFAILICMDRIGCFPFLSRMVIISVSIVVVVNCIVYLFKPIKTYRIDISNIGQIRLTAYFIHDDSHDDHGNNGEIVSMMDGSTLWPSLLLLCLQSDTGRKHILCVLPNSVPSQSFRMLLVACRWIAGHSHDSNKSEV